MDKSFSDVILELALDQAGKNLNNDKAWATISNEITKTCSNRNIPQSIAKQIESRNKTTDIEGGKISCLRWYAGASVLRCSHLNRALNS